jgi:polyferredoxin
LVVRSLIKDFGQVCEADRILARSKVLRALKIFIFWGIICVVVFSENFSELVAQLPDFCHRLIVRNIIEFLSIIVS